MPQQVKVTLLSPSHDAAIDVHRKISLNGRYRDDKGGIDVPLVPGMHMNGGSVQLRKDTQELLARDIRDAKMAGDRLFIDLDLGRQVKYDAKTRTFSPSDGRYEYASNVKKDAQDLRIRGDDPMMKWKWWIFAMVAVCLVALVVAIYMIAEANKRLQLV